VPHQVVGPAGGLARARPAAEAAERPGHFADVAHRPLVQPPQVAGLVAVALVEGQPVEGQAVGQGAVELPQGDLPLGPVDEVVGDAGLAAALAVGVPGLGQEQVGVEEGLVAAAGEAGVDGDDAVLDLAGLAAVLPLDARGVGAVLDGAGLVVQADGAEAVGGQAGKGGGEVLLQLGPGLGEGPAVVAEELLEGADGDAGGQGDGLAGLAGQVGEQAAAVDAEQVEGLGVVAAKEELLQVVGEGWPQLLDLFGCQGNLPSRAGGSVRNTRPLTSYS
jgi:hypothetical protein